MADLRIKVSLSIGLAGSDQVAEYVSDDYTLEEWNELSDMEREDYLDGEADSHLGNHLDLYACVVEEEK